MSGKIKTLAAPMGLSEYECSDGTIFYNLKSAKAYQKGLTGTEDKRCSNCVRDICTKDNFPCPYKSF